MSGRNRRGVPLFSIFIVLVIVLYIVIKPIYDAIGVPSEKRLTVTIVISLIVLLILAILIIYMASAKHKGKKGEKTVAHMLNWYVEHYGGYVINDIIIPGEATKTSQIDHILLASSGIWVIETKNYSGKIYGSEYDYEWTQVLNYGSTKNRFYNPIKQNETHINNLRKLLGDKKYIYSCVVLTQDNLNSYCRGVYSVHSLRQYLVKVRNDAKYSLYELNKIYTTLLECKKTTSQSTRQHVRNIRESR